MDAKDLRADSAVGDCNNDGNKYVQNIVADRDKQYQDVGSNTLAKMDVQTSRPCAVIGPDRVIPSSTPNDSYLKRATNEPWPFADVYRRLPEYPHNMEDYQNPTRNISPRQTFQENMPRIMVPPRYNITKSNEDPNFPMDRGKNFRLNMPPEAKYCDVPYTVNVNEQKNFRNTDICMPPVNRGLPRNVSDRWLPAVNVHPARPYASQELYQFPDYTSCSAPRPPSMNRPQRTTHDIPSHVHPDTYFPEGSVRLKPYPTMKERYPTPRYDYINNYSGPYNAPYKYDLQKSAPPHSYSTYPIISPKYIDNRIPETIADGFQRLPPNQQVNYSVPFRNQIIHPLYGPMGNGMQNKLFPYIPDGSVKPSNKIPFEVNNKQYIDYENIRAKTYTTSNGYYNNDIPRQSVKNQVSLPPYPTGNIHPHYPYFRKDGAMYTPMRNVDPSMHLSSKLPLHQFSPNIITMSPSDSNTSIDVLQGHPLEDCGYVNQSSATNTRSMDISLRSLDFYKNYEYRYGQAITTSPMISKPVTNSTAGDNKNLNVRQFLQMWNEGDDESTDNTNKDIVQTSNDVCEFTRQCGINNDQEELYVLGLVKNVPTEELSKYEHIQKVSKLPENIKGYTSIELLNQFEEAIESSNLDIFNKNVVAPKESHSHLSVSVSSNQQNDYLSRPMSPLDVEAKISQSVIHKDVGCNFEIKPCSPKMLNVEIAAPVQTLLAERAIEKVANPLMTSPLMLPNVDACKIMKLKNSRTTSENIKGPSCQIANTQFLDTTGVAKTNYTFQDLESSSGVSLASLPRLDNDIEFSFPEINQQFINANKIEVEGVIGMPKDLPSLDDHLNNDYDTTKMENSTSYNFSKEINCDHEFTKLSKYRRVKGDFESKYESNIMNKAQIMRTDSVIIMNPENPMGIEANEKLKPTVNLTVSNQQTKCSIIKSTNENEYQSNAGISEEQQNMAIDFSLTGLDSNLSPERRIAMKDEKGDHETRENEHSKKNHYSDQVKYDMLSHVKTDTRKNSFTIDNFNMDINDPSSDGHTNNDFKDIITVCQSKSREIEKEKYQNANSTANFTTPDQDQNNSFNSLYCFNEEHDTKNNKEISSDLQVYSNNEKENSDENSTIVNPSQTIEVEKIRNSLLNSEHLAKIIDSENCCKNNVGDPLVIQLPDSKVLQENCVENPTKSPCDYHYENCNNGTEGIFVHPYEDELNTDSEHATIKFANNIDLSRHSTNNSIKGISICDKIKVKPFVKIWSKELNSPRIQNLLINNIDLNNAGVNNSFRLSIVETNNEKSNSNNDTITLTKSNFLNDNASSLSEGNSTNNNDKFHTEASTKYNSSLDNFSQVQEYESNEVTKIISSKLEKKIEADVLKTLHYDNENKHVCVSKSSKQEMQSKKECHIDVKFIKNCESDTTEAEALNHLNNKNISMDNEENLLKLNNDGDAVVNSNEGNCSMSQTTTSCFNKSEITVMLPVKDNTKITENQVVIEAESYIPTTDSKGETNHFSKYSNDSEDIILNNSNTSEVVGNNIEKMVHNMESSKENKKLFVTEQCGNMTVESNEIPEKMRFKSDENFDEKFQNDDNLKDEKSVFELANERNSLQKIINDSSRSNYKEIDENNIKDKAIIENMETLKENENSCFKEKCGIMTDAIKEKNSQKTKITNSISIDYSTDSVLKSEDDLEDESPVELKNERKFYNKYVKNSENFNITTSLISNTEDLYENNVNLRENGSSTAKCSSVTNDKLSPEAPEKFKMISVEEFSCIIPKKEERLIDQSSVLGVKCEPTNSITYAIDSQNININNSSNNKEVEKNKLINMEMIDNIKSLKKNENFSGKNNNLTDTIPDTSKYSEKLEETKLDSTKVIDDKFLEDNNYLNCVNFESHKLENRERSQSDNPRNLGEQPSDIHIFTDAVASILIDNTTGLSENILLCTDKNNLNSENILLNNQITHKSNMEENLRTTDDVDILEKNVTNSASSFDCDKIQLCDENIEIICTKKINRTSNDGTLPSLEVQKEELNINSTMSCEDENSLEETNPVFQDDSCLKSIRTCKRKTLKRSLSDSALYINFDSNEEQDSQENYGPKKRRKIEHKFIAENFCNIIHNQRRKSMSTVYSPENVSFCILIDDDCFVTNDNDETQNLCYTEITENCLSDINKECIETVVETSVISYSQSEDTNLVNSDSFILENDCDKDVNETWVDDVACVETVVSDEMVDDMLINDSNSPSEHVVDFQYENDFSDGTATMNCSINDHMKKVKHIYGDAMCNNGEDLVKTLYSTPQMNVNKTLFNKEIITEDGHCRENYILPQSGNTSPYLTLVPSFNSEESLAEIADYERKNSKDCMLKEECKHIVEVILKEDEEKDIQPTIVTKQTQDDTVNSCESSVDNVFSYEKREEGTDCVSSCSPEVSSTTSEDKSSGGILLKITNYRGSRVSEIKDTNTINNDKINSKYTENKNYSHTDKNSSITRPLITKGAQKYIPPLKEIIPDLKVKLSLPHKSLLKLKLLKMSKGIIKPDIKLKKDISKCDMRKPYPKKLKPKFEDVLKSIDEIQFKKHKEKTKKTKTTIPKVVIKKNENGSHYATHNQKIFDPDMTGRKWQPWVFIEKNSFIDKMAMKNKTKAIFSHRKNTYVLAENFKKYKSVNNKKFIISQPKLDEISKGNLKYTIRLKHTY